ncbi:MAG TPA: hypothetical protein VED66_06770, partial [Candidatus Sulfotelmatobacter sp.]|nr:hypothetical protein [Candidatus Sulfotelmatobacter sp.]
MKQSWTAPAVALFALGMMGACNDYNNTVQYNTGATITNISPSALPAGTPSGTLTNCPNTPSGQTNPCFTLFVLGAATNGFQTNTVVEWNQKKLPPCTTSSGASNPSAANGCTTYIDGTDLSAAIPYSFVAKPGTAYVNTYTPQSGTGLNGLSNALTFIIYGAPNPYPLLSSISPTSAAVCTATNCAGVTITLTGSNFLPVSQNGGSSVTYTGGRGSVTNGAETAINVVSISSTQITATIPSKYLNCADTAAINVINPPSAVCIVNCPNLGGGDTNNPPSGQQATTQTFTVTGTPACSASSAANAARAVAEETPAVSQDGRYVAYASMQNEHSQILLRDTCVGAGKDCAATTQTISVATDGTVGNGDSHDAVMTPDGRYVAFSSAATNLAANAPPGRQVYLRDTCVGAPASCKASTSLISSDEEGKLTGTEAILPSISASGRFVAFLAVTPSASSGSAKSAPANGAA